MGDWQAIVFEIADFYFAKIANTGLDGAYHDIIDAITLTAGRLRPVTKNLASPNASTM